MLFLVDSPRDVPDSITSSIDGDGTALLLRKPCKRLSTATVTFTVTQYSVFKTRDSILDRSAHSIYDQMKSPSYGWMMQNQVFI